ncbi:hypothetical protein [Microbispora triticiradicis]|uniref:hypothetical protein n=1 Tax=Microbispora triticiradicis TaxID=2200763 RepID=UPI001AD75580|nr:hypothetical protein [Microbispora triticiradicis]MBO4272319.1 hypothetical protein [Microbispora triticiradicis]
MSNGAAGSGGAGPSGTTDETWPDAPSDDFDSPSPGPPSGASSAFATARPAGRPAAPAGSRQAWPETVPGRGDAGADVSELTGMALIQRELGGRIIEEIDHS